MLRARLKPRLPQLCLILALATMFGPTVALALREWTRHPAISHGLAVTFVVIWLAVICWPKVSRILPLSTAHYPLSTSPGYLALAAAVAIRASLPIRDSSPLALLSVIIALGGIVVALRGWAALRALLAPYLLSFGVLPTPGFFYHAVAPHLQVPVAIGTAVLLRMAGITAVREGTSLTLRGGSFEVNPSCSGVHSLLALVLVAAVVAAIARGSVWRRLLLPVLAVVVAPLINVARVAFVVAFTAWRGEFRLTERIHQASGFVAFCLAGLILWAAFRCLRLTLATETPPPRSPTPDPRPLIPDPRRYLLAAAITLAGALVMYLR